jgi:hypothetical protein
MVVFMGVNLGLRESAELYDGDEVVDVDGLSFKPRGNRDGEVTHGPRRPDTAT